MITYLKKWSSTNIWQKFEVKFLSPSAFCMKVTNNTFQRRTIPVLLHNLHVSTMNRSVNETFVTKTFSADLVVF